MEQLKAQLPAPTNTLNSPDYVTCLDCKGEFTKCVEGGLCLDCRDKARKLKREAKVNEEFLLSRLGEKGAKEYFFESYEQGSGNIEAYNKLFGFNPLAHNIYLTGKCGTGKSHLAGAAWRKCLGEGLKCEFIKQPELNRIFRMLEVEAEQKLLRKFCDFDVLVIDDIGVGKSTEHANLVLYEILDMRAMRYKNGIILTSNLSITEFSNKVQDDRLPSRISGLCDIVKITSTKDYRWEK